MSKINTEKDTYLDEKECLEILSVAKSRFKIIVEQFDIPKKSSEGKLTYLEQSILEFKSKRDKFYEEHIPVSQAQKEYSRPLCAKVNPIEVPSAFIMSRRLVHVSIHRLPSRRWVPSPLKFHRWLQKTCVRSSRRRD